MDMEKRDLAQLSAFFIRPRIKCLIVDLSCSLSALQPLLQSNNIIASLKVLKLHQFEKGDDVVQRFADVLPLLCSLEEFCWVTEQDSYQSEPISYSPFRPLFSQLPCSLRRLSFGGLLRSLALMDFSTLLFKEDWLPLLEELSLPVLDVDSDIAPSLLARALWGPVGQRLKVLQYHFLGNDVDCFLLEYMLSLGPGAKKPPSPTAHKPTILPSLERLVLNSFDWNALGAILLDGGLPNLKRIEVMRSCWDDDLMVNLTRPRDSDARASNFYETDKETMRYWLAHVIPSRPNLCPWAENHCISFDESLPNPLFTEFLTGLLQLEQNMVSCIRKIDLSVCFDFGGGMCNALMAAITSQKLMSVESLHLPWLDPAYCDKNTWQAFVDVVKPCNLPLLKFVTMDGDMVANHKGYPWLLYWEHLWDPYQENEEDSSEEDDDEDDEDDWEDEYEDGESFGPLYC